MQTPSTTLTSPGGTTSTVPLRDYLNTRLAPFLKKVINESLDQSPEYPLQYLGEALINQSILYEGNTEAEKLKQHFKYTFNIPKQVQPESTTSIAPEQNGVPATTESSTAQTTVVNGEQQVEDQTMSEKTEEVQSVPPPPVAVEGQTANQEQGGGGTDTEMGGTT